MPAWAMLRRVAMPELGTGSGNLEIPWDRMHRANCSCASRFDSAGDPASDEPDDATVVVVSPVLLLLPLVRRLATPGELGPPHAANSKAAPAIMTAHPDRWYFCIRLISVADSLS